MCEEQSKDIIKSDTSKKSIIKVNGKRSYKRTDSNTWARIKADWESGTHTLNELTKKYDVKRETIWQKVQRQKWVKGKLESLIQENVAQRNARILVEKGLTDELVAETMVEGMTKPIVVVFEGKGEAMQANTVPDYKLRLDYVRERNKMVGAHVGTDDGGTPKEGDKHLHIHLQPPKDATPQQSLASYLSLIRGETG